MPPRPKPHPETLAVGAVLTVLIALGQISTSVYVPSMPALVSALDTDVAHVNMTLGVFLVGFGVAQLVYGPLSDLYGRRRVLIAGLAVYLVASIACAAAPTIEALLVARFVQAVGACAGPVLGRAIVRDVYGRERSAKALAYIGVAFTASPAVTPIIGGYLQVWFGWRANFLFLVFVAGCVLLAVWLLLAETRPESARRRLHLGNLVRGYGRLFKNPAYMGYALGVSFIYAALMTHVGLAPFVLIGLLGVAPDWYGILILFNAIGFLVGSLAAGRLTTRLATGRMVILGLSLALAGCVSMSVIGLAGYFNVAVIIGPMILFMGGMAIVFPNALAGAMAPYPQSAGTASAMVGFMQMALGAAVATFAGRLALVSQVPMALVMTASCALALVSFLALAWYRRPREADRGAPESGPPR